MTRQEVLYRSTCAIAATGVFAIFFALGHNVTQNGEPLSLVALETALLNHSTLIAWWLTWMGYPQVLAPACVLLLVAAWRYPQWRGRVLFGIAVLLICWLGADFFQHFFARPRRFDWVVRHETAFSYPSSHAAIAVGFYLFWAEMMRKSDLAAGVRLPIALLLYAVCAGILWARLALGAHYVTDLEGGALWAVVTVAACLSVAPTKVLSPPEGRP
jgi:undecaprenyl-diphosphatase